MENVEKNVEMVEKVVVPETPATAGDVEVATEGGGSTTIPETQAVEQVLLSSFFLCVVLEVLYPSIC
jgi:hypothetical protein